MVEAKSSDSTGASRAGIRDILRASAAGSFLASLLTLGYVWVDDRIRGSAGALNLAPRQLIFLFAVAFSLGMIVSALALFEILTVLHGERMSTWPVPAVIAIGATAGGTLITLVFAVVSLDAVDLLFGGFGAVYGGSVAGFWIHFRRRMTSHA